MAETSPSRVSYDFVTRAIARTLGNPGKGYYALLALAVALLGVGIVCLLFLLRYGLGLAGYSHPVYCSLHHLFRLLGRYRPLGDADLGDPVSVPLGVAHRGVSHRGGREIG